ncbi:carnitine dehydratase, partial [Mycolicibacter hiberniae]|nr:carnitine dehydratase [Mycolicibacter hiberniae]
MTSVPIQRDLTAPPDISADFNKLLAGLQLDIADTGGEVIFTGQDPILPSNHRLGAIMAMGMMAPAVATQILYRLRDGPEQDLSVDLRRAVAHINPTYNFAPTVGGYAMLPAAATANPFGFSIYPTKDDRWY